jgi:hypothetical protein
MGEENLVERNLNSLKSSPNNKEYKEYGEESRNASGTQENLRRLLENPERLESLSLRERKDLERILGELEKGKPLSSIDAALLKVYANYPLEDEGGQEQGGEQKEKERKGGEEKSGNGEKEEKLAEEGKEGENGEEREGEGEGNEGQGKEGQKGVKEEEPAQKESGEQKVPSGTESNEPKEESESNKPEPEIPKHPPFPGPLPEPKPSPEPSPEPTPSGEKEPKSVEGEVLTVEQAEANLNSAIREYLKLFGEHVVLEIKLKKARKESDRLKYQEELSQSELFLSNARNLYRKALDEYKIALYFDLIRKKKDYLRERILREKIIKENPTWNRKQVEEEVKRLANDKSVLAEVDQEVEKILRSREEQETINNEIIGAIAYNILRKEEELAQRELNIRMEKEQKHARFFGKLWSKFRGLSMARRATIGAVVAGASAGTLAALGGAGFAALGIGAAYTIRRFFGGAVVGSGLQNIAHRIIGRKERRELDEETKRRVDEIKSEISSIISNPEKEPKSYENWLKLASKLDERLNEVIQVRNDIREKNNKKRRLWTLISALIGGVAANADNIFHALFGTPKAQAAGVVDISKEPPYPTIGKPSSAEVVGSSLDQKALDSTILTPVGRDGFWGAAQSLKEQLGLSDQEFAEAWGKAVVVDSFGKEIPLPQAHWVLPLEVNQTVGLVYNPVKRVFEVVSNPMVEIGDFRKLIDAYGGSEKVPAGVIWSILRGSGYK